MKTMHENFQVNVEVGNNKNEIEIIDRLWKYSLVASEKIKSYKTENFLIRY